jgi:Fe2+ transport system protein FeoA
VDIPLSLMEAGQHSQVTYVEADAATLAFLSGEGIGPGASIAVLGTGYEGAALVEVGGRPVYLTRGIAEKIKVKKTGTHG